MSILGTIFSGGAKDLVEGVGDVIDNLHTSKEEKLEAEQKIKELVASYQTNLGSDFKFTGGTGIDAVISGTTLTISTDATVPTNTSVATFQNKSFDLSNNTLTGTTSQFNTALSDGNFATIAGTETLTGKTIDLTDNTITGTTAEFNTALSDGDFATLDGTEILTNKTNKL